MNYPMVVLGGLLWLWRVVDENRKNASIFAILVVWRRRLPFDGVLGSLLPIWLIASLLHRSLEVLIVVGWRLSLVLVA